MVFSQRNKDFKTKNRVKEEFEQNLEKVGRGCRDKEPSAHYV